MFGSFSFSTLSQGLSCIANFLSVRTKFVPSAESMDFFVWMFPFLKDFFTQVMNSNELIVKSRISFHFVSKLSLCFFKLSIALLSSSFLLLNSSSSINSWKSMSVSFQVFFLQEELFYQCFHFALFSHLPH